MALLCPVHPSFGCPPALEATQAADAQAHGAHVVHLAYGRFEVVKGYTHNKIAGNGMGMQ